MTLPPALPETVGTGTGPKLFRPRFGLQNLSKEQSNTYDLNDPQRLRKAVDTIFAILAITYIILYIYYIKHYITA